MSRWLLFAPLAALAFAPSSGRAVDWDDYRDWLEDRREERRERYEDWLEDQREWDRDFRRRSRRYGWGYPPSFGFTYPRPGIPYAFPSQPYAPGYSGYRYPHGYPYGYPRPRSGGGFRIGGPRGGFSIWW